MNKNSETNNSKKYYALFETDEDGIRQFRNASPEDKKGVTLSTMRVEGKKVPAFKVEVDKPTYDHFKREQWMQEYHYKMENRCTICGQNGKSRICPINVPNPEYVEGGTAPKTIANDCSKCPYNRMFKTFKGKVLFSTLTLSDEQGNEDAFEPEDTIRSISSADDYDHLLTGFIDYVKEHYPKYAHYTELIKILGTEVGLKEAAAVMDKPQRTLYGWTRTLRPIFDEYMQTVVRP